MNTFLKTLTWAFGIICTLILIGIVLVILAHLLDTFPKTLSFNQKQLDFSLETAKIFLPLCCGYILFVAPAIKYVKTKHLIWNRQIILGTALTFSFGIVAIGLWSGTFAYLIKAASAIEIGKLDYSISNFCFERAIKISQLAHLCFFASIAWFITTIILTLLIEKYQENSPN